MIKKLIKVELPSEYQRVEYLESTGTQYIDIGLTAKDTFKIKSELMLINSDSPNIAHIFGVYDVNKGITFNCKTSTSTSRFGNSSRNITILNPNQFYKLEYSNNGCFINGVNYWTPNSTPFTSTLNFYLFKANNSSTMGSYRLKYFTIYEVDALLLNFIPCYRKSDGIAGMYDLVSGEFFTNAGTGSFIVGEDVNEPIEIMKEIKAVKRYVGGQLKDITKINKIVNGEVKTINI